jgi:hypothetical protein
MIGCDFVLISARRTNKPHGSHGRYDPASSNSRRALDCFTAAHPGAGFVPARRAALSFCASSATLTRGSGQRLFRTISVQTGISLGNWS